MDFRFLGNDKSGLVPSLIDGSGLLISQEKMSANENGHPDG
jgi:hypothetical protein